MGKRDLDFKTGQDVIDEINRLRRSGYEATGKWNLTQICEHLTETTKGGLEGFGFRLPWILRATVVKWVFRFALKRRKLLSGAPTFPRLKPKSSSAEENAEVIDECIATTQKAIEFDGSLEDYALLDNLSVEDWQQFMWIHAAHHLGFLIPKKSAV